MAKKIELKALAEKTVEFENNHKIHFLNFNKISANAKLQSYVRQEGVGDSEITPKSISLGILVEAQNKIERLNGGKMIAFLATNDANKGVILSNVNVDLGYNGEIFLGDNDTLNLKFSDLNQLPTSDFYAIEGQATASKNYQFKDFTIRDIDDEKLVDVSEVDFLIFKNDADSMPSEIEIFYGNEIVRLPTDLIMRTQNENFGIVSVLDNVPKIGSVFCSVISVKSATKLILKNEENNSFDFYAVKLS